MHSIQMKAPWREGASLYWTRYHAGYRRQVISGNGVSSHPPGPAGTRRRNFSRSCCFLSCLMISRYLWYPGTRPSIRSELCILCPNYSRSSFRTSLNCSGGALRHMHGMRTKLPSRFPALCARVRVKRTACRPERRYVLFLARDGGRPMEDYRWCHHHAITTPMPT